MKRGGWHGEKIRGDHVVAAHAVAVASVNSPRSENGPIAAVASRVARRRERREREREVRVYGAAAKLRACFEYSAKTARKAAAAAAAGDCAPTLPHTHTPRAN